jgi:ABC-type transporter Mla subunit MlaD
MDRSMNARSPLVRIVLFWLLTVISLVALVSTLGLVPRLGLKDRYYDIIFPTATGLVPGTPLRLLGVTIGEMREAAIDEPAGGGPLRARVRVCVQARYAHLVREGILVRQVPRGLLGERTLEAELPEHAGPPLAPGATMAGEVVVDIPALLAEVSAAVKELRVATHEIKSLLLSPEGQRLVRDVGVLARGAAWVVERLEEILRAIKEAVEALARASDHIARKWPFK